MLPPRAPHYNAPTSAPTKAHTKQGPQSGAPPRPTPHRSSHRAMPIDAPPCRPTACIPHWPPMPPPHRSSPHRCPHRSSHYNAPTNAPTKAPNKAPNNFVPMNSVNPRALVISAISFQVPLHVSEVVQAAAMAPLDALHRWRAATGMPTAIQAPPSTPGLRARVVRGYSV